LLIDSALTIRGSGSAGAEFPTARGNPSSQNAPPYGEIPL
jgi:hypothetical protein